VLFIVKIKFFNRRIRCQVKKINAQFAEKPVRSQYVKPAKHTYMQKLWGKRKNSEKGIKIGGDVLADKAAGHKTGGK